MIKRLNDVLDEANQLAQLCESESGDLILESDQEIANLQMKIGSLQVSIRETREQLENLYTSEGHFTEAENQHLKELRSIESAIMQANEKIEKAKSHRKRCLWASVVLIPLVVISPVLLFTAMGPITAHIENYQKIKQTTQDSASRSQQKLQLVRLQLKQTVETAKELEGALQVVLIITHILK